MLLLDLFQTCQPLQVFRLLEALPGDVVRGGEDPTELVKHVVLIVEYHLLLVLLLLVRGLLPLFSAGFGAPRLRLWMRLGHLAQEKTRVRRENATARAVDRQLLI